MKEMANIKKVCAWLAVLDSYVKTGKKYSGTARNRVRKNNYFRYECIIAYDLPRYGYQPYEYPDSIQELFAHNGYDYDNIEWADDPIPKRWEKLSFPYKEV